MLLFLSLFLFQFKFVFFQIKILKRLKFKIYNIYFLILKEIETFKFV